MKHRISLFSLFSIAAICVSACGGGGGGGSSPPPVSPPISPPPPPATQGQFKDANVSGLDYAASGGMTGTTDALGRFGFGTGDTVEFSVGAVVIGSAAGASIVTPVDLVPGGSGGSTEVRNIVRFLMMLDQDEDPSNGIAISQPVRDVAANWAQVDFTTGDLDNELVTIISDVASVDNRAANLPGSQAAGDHLAGTTYCVLSGYFRGELTGDRGSTLHVLVDPATGRVLARFPGSPTAFESDAAITIDGTRAFNAVAADGSGDNFEGRFDSWDEISGVWSIGQDSGEFTASRQLPDPAAIYRFTGQWFRDTVSPNFNGALVLQVDADGNLTGESADLTAGSVYTASGTFDGQVFDYNWSTSDGNDAGSRGGTVDADLYVMARAATMPARTGHGLRRDAG